MVVEDGVDVPGSGPVAFGAFSFDDNGNSSLIVPSIVYGFGDGLAWRTVIGPSETMSALEETDANKPPEKAGASKHMVISNEWSIDGSGEPADLDDWQDRCRAIQLAIGSGPLQKAVLARQVIARASFEFDRTSIVRKLAAAYPGCFTFDFENWIGASPELLVRKLGDVADSMPIAGSAPRDAFPAEDERLGAELRISAKNLKEHSLTVNSVLAAMDPYCTELAAEAEPSLMLLANVQHLSTKVQGRLKGGADALQLAGALHPTAAVCGYPRNSALKLISQIEDLDRGRYAGPVGWIDAKGDGEWAIALRCAELDGKTASLFAGAGIMPESDPAAEFEETQLKLTAILNALC